MNKYYQTIINNNKNLIKDIEKNLKEAIAISTDPEHLQNFLCERGYLSNFDTDKHNIDIFFESNNKNMGYFDNHITYKIHLNNDSFSKYSLSIFFNDTLVILNDSLATIVYYDNDNDISFLLSVIVKVSDKYLLDAGVSFEDSAYGDINSLYYEVNKIIEKEPEAIMDFLFLKKPLEKEFIDLIKLNHDIIISECIHNEKYKKYLIDVNALRFDLKKEINFIKKVKI